MRKLILKRIEDIRISDDGFSKFSPRWKDVVSKRGVHISDLAWDLIDDRELLWVFEKIVKAYYSVGL